MFFDIGAGEFLVIAIVAVLLLGPDRLPRAISSGVRWLRVLRDQATKARGDIMAAAERGAGATLDGVRIAVPADSPEMATPISTGPPRAPVSLARMAPASAWPIQMPKSALIQEPAKRRDSGVTSPLVASSMVTGSMSAASARRR